MAKKKDVPFYFTRGSNGIVVPFSTYNRSHEDRAGITHSYPENILTSLFASSLFSAKGSRDTRTRGYNLQNETSLFSRYGEVTDSTSKAIMRDSLTAYYTIGMVRNIIDMMAEMCVKGLRIVHPNRGVQEFWDTWSNETNIVERSERFVNTLLRMGNVVVAEQEVKLKLSGPKKRTVEVPQQFIFLNPLSLDFDKKNAINEPKLYMNITQNAASLLKNKSAQDVRELLGTDIVDKVENNRLYLNMDKIFIGYYKKDDWQDWAFGIIFGALDDIEYKRKLRDMDRAAADGVINAIRIFKLGDHKANPPMLPGPAAFAKLADVLQDNPGGGVLDIIWDSLIDMVVEYPPVDKILGSEKYTAVNADILSDFGISSVLSGGTGGSANFAGQVMSVKPLIEKLIYIRNVLMSWLGSVIKEVTEAMKFRKEAEVYFDMPSFTDEVGMLRVAMQAWDRGIFSNDEMLQLFRTSWSFQKQKLIDEQTDREDNPDALLRLGPFMNPQVIEMLALLNRGEDPNNPGDNETDIEQKPEGRPPGTDRKPQEVERETKPQGADREDIAMMSELYSLIQYQEMARGKLFDAEKLVTAKYLKESGVQYVKGLNSEQTKELDDLIFKVFAATVPDTEVDKEFVEKALRTEAPEKLDRCVRKVYRQLVDRFRKKNGREPNKDERRELKSSAWAICRRQLGL